MAEVAVLGLGRMGSAMAERLVREGHRVRVWNRTPGAAHSLVRAVGSDRASIADQPAEAVAGAEVVLSMLAHGEASIAVLTHPDLLAALDDDTVVVDLATNGVEAADRINRAFLDAGRRYVDAPVSGSVAAVAAGTLLIMASGDPADVDRARDVLSSLARKVLLIGPPGAGQAMKLAVNLVVHGINGLVSEALVLAERSGIDRETAYDVFEESVVAAPYVHYKRAAFLDEATPVAMSLELSEKDLRLIVEQAVRHALQLPTASAILHEVADAVAAGFGQRDMADLSRFLGAPSREDN